MEENIITVSEESVSEQGSLTSAKVPFKKKFLNFLIRLGLVLAIIGALVLFYYLLRYSFVYDGADWLREIA